MKTLSELGLNPNRKKKESFLDSNTDRGKYVELLERASDYYSALYPDRERAAINDEMFKGNIWTDPVTLDNGTTVTQKEAIRRSGRIPVENNMIYPPVMSAVGNWITNQPKSAVVSRTKDKQSQIEVFQMMLEEALQTEMADIVDADQFEKLLVRNIIIFKTTYGKDFERNIHRAFIKNVPLSNVFFNTDVEDIRVNKDINFIGEFVDLTVEQIVAAYAHNYKDAERIRSIYREYSYMNTQNTMDDAVNDDHFLNTPPNGKGRVYQIWYTENEWSLYFWDKNRGIEDTIPFPYGEKKAEFERQNKEMYDQAIAEGIPLEEVPFIIMKEEYDIVWKYAHLTPDGDVLKCGKTPYAHGSHPYVVKKVDVGLVDSIASLAKYFNRLFSLMDYIIENSAKGLTEIPEEYLDGIMDKDEILKEIRSPNGVVVSKEIKGSNRTIKQHSTNNTNIGATEMMSFVLGQIQSISGVSGAMQGQQAKSGTPSSLYAQEAQNSMVNLAKYGKIFMRGKEQRDLKMLKNIVQFTTQDRVVNVVGEQSIKDLVYEPSKAKDVDFDVRVIEGNSTAIFRQMQDDLLKELFQMQAIDVKQLLSNTSAPFAGKLLEQIKERESQAKEGATPQSMITPEEASKLQGELNPNPQAMEFLNKLSIQ